MSHISLDRNVECTSLQPRMIFFCPSSGVDLLLPTDLGIRSFTKKLYTCYVQTLWDGGPGERETASLLVLIVFNDSKTSHVSSIFCLLIPSRYQRHLDYAIARMSTSYPFVLVWDLPPDTFFFTIIQFNLFHQAFTKSLLCAPSFCK